MFGYVKPYMDELRVKEVAFYRAAYCGICREMRASLGQLSGMTLTYDSVFLALVRMAYLPDADFSSVLRRCAVHPMKPRNTLVSNDAIRYTARVFAVLSYYKCIDDREDERRGRRLVASVLSPLLRAFSKRAGVDASLADTVAERLTEISRLEREGCTSVDTLAAPFGELLGEVFAFGMPSPDAEILRVLGSSLGCFIYCADAAEDYGEDVKRRRFNPYACAYGGAPLTAENRRTIHTALSCYIHKMESAVALIPFGKRHILEGLVNNIVSRGLSERISFLLSDGETGATER